MLFTRSVPATTCVAAETMRLWDPLAARWFTVQHPCTGVGLPSPVGRMCSRRASPYTVRMELVPGILSAATAWVGVALYAAGLLAALWRMPWYWLRRDQVFSVFAGVTVATLVLWQVRASFEDGPTVHLLGATFLTLAFGWQLAILAMSIVLAATTLAAGAGWQAVGANGTVLVLLGVGISYACARASERWLPAHLFVYIFAAGFFGAAVTVVLVSLGAAAFMLASAVMPPDRVTGHYLPIAMLLLFPEAFLTGAMTTLAVVYRPDWMVSFKDSRYLKS